jgi:hypothetical protein
MNDGDADNFTMPEPEVKEYLEWLPGVDHGTPTVEPVQVPPDPWQTGAPQASDPTGESVHRLEETGAWAYVGLAALCLTAIALPMVLRPSKRRGPS